MKICESCGQEFSCSPENISACQCSTIQLSDETKKAIAEAFRDCLCIDCLLKAERATQAQGQAAQ
ncbi:MAG: cysteine-rich CWC family protein [Sumerlaeia bacterium]